MDEIYQGEIAESWQNTYEQSAKDFEMACLRSLRPFEADPNLEKEFYKAFDSIEVLPEPLLPEYMQMQTENPLLAEELLIPIRWKRYYTLIGKGQVLPRDRTLPPLVAADYNDELGLQWREDHKNEDED